MVIDEVQKSKNLALALKRIVDANHRNGQFLLTGSSNIFLLQDAADSLAGRTITIRLWPFTAAETCGTGANRLLD